VTGPAAKVEEELAEVREQLVGRPVLAPGAAATLNADHALLEAELGDLLFACVNLCRKAGVHASLALDRTNAKFEARFKRIEEMCRERGIPLSDAGLEVLDALWDEAKLAE
jgi:uncharacterized protein YabN with tetrapyrrole methylase and pyrophosphatase domain